MTWPGVIVSGTALYLAGALATMAWWAFTGDFVLLNVYLKGPGAAFLLLSAALEALLASRARRFYTPAEPMHTGWTLVMAAGILRSAGMLLAHVLSWDDGGNAGGSYIGNARTVHQSGLILGGVVHLAVIAIALLVFLVVCHRARISLRPRALDVLLLACCAAYALYEFAYVIPLRLASLQRTDIFDAIKWSTNPILVLLAAEAVLLHRAAARMGTGLVARSFHAYTAGVLLTMLGNAVLTASGWLIPWPWYAGAWLLWYPAAAAFALAPAWQNAALEAAAAPDRAAAV